MQIVNAGAVCLIYRMQGDVFGAFPGEDQSRHHHPGEHGHGQIVHKDGDQGDTKNHKDFRLGHFAEGRKGGPFEGADHHHKHHPGKGGDGNLSDHRTTGHNKKRQGHCRHNAGCAAASAGFDIDQALPDHGTAAHAAEETGEKIGGALREGFPVAFTPGFRKIVHQLQGHQRFDNADHGHRKAHAQQYFDVFHVPHDLHGQAGEREGAFKQSVSGVFQQNIGNGSRTGAEIADQAHHNNGDQRGRDCFGEFRKKLDEQHGEQHQRAHHHQLILWQPGAIDRLKRLELCHQNHNSQPVYKADHDGVGDQANKMAQFKQSEEQLDHPGNHHCGKHIFQAHARALQFSVVEGFGHYHRDCAGGTGDHARTSAEG